MKNVIYITGIAVLLMVTGCSTSYKTALVKTKYVRPAGTAHLPLLVDMVIDDSRVTGNFSCNSDLGNEYAKSQAVANALKKSGADILYEPQYVIEVLGNQVNVEVSGHPAHYKNFRQAAIMVDTVASVSNTHIVQPAPVIINTKSKGR